MTEPFDFEPLLSAEGKRRVRGGSMVSATAPSGEILADLTVGQPAIEALPLEAIAEVAAQVLPGNPAALLYGRREGAIELVDLVREKLHRFEGLEVAREQIVITNGSSQAVDMVLRSFADPDAPIALDEASFGALMVRRISSQGRHVAFDAQGPRPDELLRLVQDGPRPTVFYTIPTFQNPMGVTTSAPRRREILEVCRAERIPILEDDAYYELRYDGERVPSLFELDGGSGLVVRAGTFSKILGAGIRLGWLLTSAPLAQTIANLKPDGGTSPFASTIAAAFMREAMSEQLERLQAIYRARRDLLLAALAQHLPDFATWHEPAGGFFVWVRFNRPEIVDAVVERCAEAGVLVRNGRAFRVDGAPNGAIRLAFSHAARGALHDGVRVLGEVSATVSSEQRVPTA